MKHVAPILLWAALVIAIDARKAMGIDLPWLDSPVTWKWQIVAILLLTAMIFATSYRLLLFMDHADRVQKANDAIYEKANDEAKERRRILLDSISHLEGRVRLLENPKRVKYDD